VTIVRLLRGQGEPSGRVSRRRSGVLLVLSAPSSTALCSASNEEFRNFTITGVDPASQASRDAEATHSARFTSQTNTRARPSPAATA